MDLLRRYRVGVVVVALVLTAGAVIGGLTVSTALTLLLIPTLYMMLEERYPRRMEEAAGSPAIQGETA